MYDLEIIVTREERERERERETEIATYWLS